MCSTYFVLHFLLQIFCFLACIIQSNLIYTHTHIYMYTYIYIYIYIFSFYYLFLWSKNTYSTINLKNFFSVFSVFKKIIRINAINPEVNKYKNFVFPVIPNTFLLQIFLFGISYLMNGPEVAQWLRHCATSRAVPESNPSGVGHRDFSRGYRQNHVPWGQLSL